MVMSKQEAELLVLEKVSKLSEDELFQLEVMSTGVFTGYMDVKSIASSLHMRVKQVTTEVLDALKDYLFKRLESYELQFKASVGTTKSLFADNNLIRGIAREKAIGGTYPVLKKEDFANLPLGSELFELIEAPASSEEIKAQAVKMLELIGVCDNVVDDFKKCGELSKMEQDGKIYHLTEEEKEMVRLYEEGDYQWKLVPKIKRKVYFVIHYTRKGKDEYALLYVDDCKKQWECGEEYWLREKHTVWAFIVSREESVDTGGQLIIVDRYNGGVRRFIELWHYHKMPDVSKSTKPTKLSKKGREMQDLLGSACHELALALEREREPKKSKKRVPSEKAASNLKKGRQKKVCVCEGELGE